jgi:hypothetical protein
MKIRTRSKCRRTWAFSTGFCCCMIQCTRIKVLQVLRRLAEVSASVTRMGDDMVQAQICEASRDSHLEDRADVNLENESRVKQVPPKRSTKDFTPRDLATVSHLVGWVSEALCMEIWNTGRVSARCLCFSCSTRLAGYKANTDLKRQGIIIMHTISTTSSMIGLRALTSWCI